MRRDSDPAANIRQFAAMAANGDRTDLLGRITCPALVIHGEEDPLIPVEGGRHTASCIANAELHVVDGMGHDFPEALMTQLAGRIADHCASVR